MNKAYSNERYLELLADRAIAGLDDHQASELQQLFQEHSIEDDLSFDLTAAAIDLAVGQEANEGLPSHLRSQVMESAKATMLTDQSADAIRMQAVDPAPEKSLHHDRLESGKPPFSRRDLLWGVTLAASLLLVLIAWWPSKPTDSNQEITLTAAKLRERWQTAPPNDLVKVKWASPDKSLQGELGEVAWSDDLQQGYMTFTGLKPNDPTKEQYQLWIFDKNRDEKYPVDGGVFDVDQETGETIVMIDQKIKVDTATLFAITVEKPGGVVVSSRERLPLIAPVNQP